ncbi:glycosyltransferase [Maribacter sp. MMG018]|uniref:glycosyltransferase n=1 Tax=Maribacter sp. MMG018 TaxID=2822688 RepID=UPI001B35AA24|nr:glycosyltransferase [Maribacter sp. MMG018]MBQ4915637.1 glycosyltransferase [Maribacter sp. MMG018]
MPTNQKSSSEYPLVSVIVPVYNVANYLERCIESIIHQTHKNLDIILVNDGSTDNSGSLCDTFTTKDDRIRVVHQKNGGLSAARNTGMGIMKGDFVIFVDSDDWLKTKMIEKLLSFALEHNLELVECGILNSRDLNNHINSTGNSFIENQSEAMLRLLKTNNFSVWRRIYSKRIVEGRKFIPGKISEDVFFTIDSINLIEKQGFIPEKLYIYNTENISITRSPYSLKKLDAKDALYYIVEKTRGYGEDIKALADQYLLRGLINHYNPLFTHAHLDPDLKHRKELKNAIKQEMTKMRHLGIESGVSKTESFFLKLPFWLYGIIRRVNKKRIDVQLYLLKRFNV